MAGLKNLRKRRRVQIIVATFVALALATALIGNGMRDGINFFRTPSEVVAAPPPPGEVFRIGGLVEPGSLVRGEGTQIRFAITDGGATVAVTYDGILPDLFEEDQGVVAQGSLVDGTLQATEILAKHDETYMPKEVIDALKEQGVYVAPDAGAAGN